MQAIWSSFLVLTGTYGVIVSRVIYTEWIFFAALALGPIALRRQRPHLSSFRAWGFPAVPVLFALVCFAIVLNQIATDPRESATGLALVAAGLPVYFVWRRIDARDRLSQSLLPAEIHEGAAVGGEQRPRDRR
jgi:APA family basic amino acid/polyamine antiporter